MRASSTAASTTRANRSTSPAARFRPNGALGFRSCFWRTRFRRAQSFITVLYYVYLLCIIAYILTSWVPLPYNVWLNRVQRFLYDVVDPYLRLFRRLLPQLSVAGLGLDLSPIVAILVLTIVYRLVLAGIGALG